MLSESVLFALNNVNDTFLEEARELLGDSAKSRCSGKRRIVRVLLIAAVITALMGATAFAFYHATMSSRVPEEGTTEYHVLYQADPQTRPELLHVNFDRTKIAFSFDVPADGYFPVMRANNLPGKEENWTKTSFYSMLKMAQYFGLPWDMKPVDPENMEINPIQEPLEFLRKAGMDAETANSWFTSYIYRDPDRDVAEDSMDIIRIELYGGYKLHGQEVILGAFSTDGTEARIVQESNLEDYQIVEVQMLQASGTIDNHLFLFHPEKYFLLHISGNDKFYGFSMLEQIARNTEVIETGLYIESYEDKVNFILADLAAG